MQDLEGFGLGFRKVRVVEGARIFVTRDGALKSASRKDQDSAHFCSSCARTAG